MKIKFIGNRKKSIYSKPCSFEGLITKYINANYKEINLVDVGANRGSFYKEIRLIYKNSIINAFLIEPIPECINELQSKFSANKNITIKQAAISDHKESRDFHINQFDETSSLLKIKEHLKELEDVDIKQNQILKLTTSTLDEVLSEQNLNWNKIDILKIDVQGCEDKVLIGGRNTLMKTHLIWVEVSFKPLYDGSCLFNDIYSILNDSGFALLEISDGHRSSQNELLQVNCLFRNLKII